ncbi:hypothetical protein NE237_022064 [Protea cynaroides]|uniref:Uncharacterized protein n=1 Tax=Protea cynaroides TaxID=273540 RepID=A0A9Q0JS23_9MAGN|nr:hypothetical protein NE237_022064 [Protea cynaroides]
MHQFSNLHGWSLCSQPRCIFKAIIFCNELNLLEIKWHELMPYVSQFIILKSKTTFTGIPKPLFFTENRSHFEFAEGKIVHGVFPDRIAKPGSHENPFNLESQHCGSMNVLICQADISNGDFLIIYCNGVNESPQKMHLEPRHYMYSFEFLVDFSSRRPKVYIYNPWTKYGHYRHLILYFLMQDGIVVFVSDIFKNLYLKYSHADRRIQNIICTGDDLFDMLPKEYNFQELIKKLGPIQKSTFAFQLPAYLVDNANRFRFLLRGNCLRISNTMR